MDRRGLSRGVPRGWTVARKSPSHPRKDGRKMWRALFYPERRAQRRRGAECVATGPKYYGRSSDRPRETTYDSAGTSNLRQADGRTTAARTFESRWGRPHGTFARSLSEVEAQRRHYFNLLASTYRANQRSAHTDRPPPDPTARRPRLPAILHAATTEHPKSNGAGTVPVGAHCFKMTGPLRP